MNTPPAKRLDQVRMDAWRIIAQLMIGCTKPVKNRWPVYNIDHRPPSIDHRLSSIVRTMPIIDISRTLQPGMAVWPGDPPFAREAVASRAAGDIVNLTRLVMSAHTGAHIDAPHHFADAAATVEQLDLGCYWGPAQVVTVTKRSGPLFPADFAHVDLAAAPRLLVHSPASELDPTQFPDHYVYPSPELAAVLAANGVILFGADAPSVDAVDSADLAGHHALLAAGVAILEGLDLRYAADGLYELVALPLKIAGGDGSPVRAALRPLNL